MTSRTHRQILAMWPTRTGIARRLDLPPTTVHSWFQTGVIPGERDVALMALAIEDGLRLDYSELAHGRAIAAPT